MDLRKAAFGMGCFWGPDALFGSLRGVIRTRVGYAGGEKEDPTYRDLGDHTETVLVEYDPEKLSYEDLLDVFWENHDFRNHRKPQYASKIFYMNDEQKDIAEALIQNYTDAETDIQELENVDCSPGGSARSSDPEERCDFTVAEDYHQKYRLRHSKLIKNFENMRAKEFRDSPLAARLNAYVAGKLDKADIEEFELEVDPGLKEKILNRLRS